MGQPDINAFFDQLCSRYAWDFGALRDTFALGPASGILRGSNPPYGAADFFTLYPKFGGSPVVMTGMLSGSVLSDVVPPVGLGLTLSAGWPVVGTGAPNNSIQAFDPSGNTVTFSQSPAVSGSVNLLAYNPQTYLLPAAVISTYISLANASLQQARWRAEWSVAMGWFIAHFCTLWLDSDGFTTTDRGRAAASGLASGIKVSKGVGPASLSIQPVQGLEHWGAWTLTKYGTLLATRAKTVGSGPIYVR